MIRGFVTEVVKSKDQATIRYRLPDGKSARYREVLDTDLFGGAEGMVDRTYFDRFQMVRDAPD